jgi:SSS family solute:Na+ symporter
MRCCCRPITLLLGLLALLGYMGHAAGLKLASNNDVVPALFKTLFPSWFAGFAFAAIAIGALVPASVMSIAAANLFARNIWKEYVDREGSPAREATVSRIASLAVKVGALVFILLAPTDYAINFQLAGGVWILQTLPAVFLALYVRWVERTAVIAGWVVGMAWGTYMLIDERFASSLVVLGGHTIYIALAAIAANLVVVVVGSALVRALGHRTTGVLAEGDYWPSGAAAPVRDPLAYEPEAGRRGNARTARSV